MATSYSGTPVTDPDDLLFQVDEGSGPTFSTATEEILIDVVNRTIALKRVGNLTSEGVTLKTLYSAIKDAWQNDTGGPGSSNRLIKFPFPFTPITDEQFELKDGWTLDKTNANPAGGSDPAQDTESLIRTGGWTVNNDANPSAVVEEWFSFITLGVLGTADQVYYERGYKNGSGIVTKLDPEDVVLTDAADQAIQIYGSLGAARTDVSFDATGNVITTVAGDVSPFSVGDVIVVDTTSNTNDGVYTITEVNVNAGTNGNIVVAEALTTENAATAGSTTIQFDYSKYFKAFCREWQKTYAFSRFEDIGVDTAVTGAGANPQAYRFPLTNTTDPDIPTTLALTDVATGGAGIVGNILAPYSNVTVDYLRASDGDPYVIKGDVQGTTSYLLGDVVYYPTDGNWYSVDADFTTVASPDPSTDTANFTLYEGQRQVGVNGNKAFTIIIDADTNVAANASGSNNLSVIYRSVQYQLRQNEDIDRGVSTPDGFELAKTSQELIGFVGPTLVTELGVYIDSFRSADNNDISLTTFSNADPTVTESVEFDFTAQLLINFGQNLIADANAKYTVFFTDPDGTTANAYGTVNAVIVEDAAGNNIDGVVSSDLVTYDSGAASGDQIVRSFAYTSNDQGGRTADQPADITAVAIGLVEGQYVRTTGTIARSVSNTISLIAALERNYTVGTA